MTGTSLPDESGDLLGSGKTELGKEIDWHLVSP